MTFKPTRRICALQSIGILEQNGELRPKRHEWNSIKTREIFINRGTLPKMILGSTKKHWALIGQNLRRKQQTQECFISKWGRSLFEIGDTQIPWTWSLDVAILDSASRTSSTTVPIEHHFDGFFLRDSWEIWDQSWKESTCRTNTIYHLAPGFRTKNAASHAISQSSGDISQDAAMRK